MWEGEKNALELAEECLEGLHAALEEGPDRRAQLEGNAHFCEALAQDLDRLANALTGPMHPHTAGLVVNALFSRGYYDWELRDGSRLKIRLGVLIELHPKSARALERWEGLRRIDSRAATRYIYHVSGGQEGAYRESAVVIARNEVWAELYAREAIEVQRSHPYKLGSLISCESDGVVCADTDPGRY